MRTNNLKGVSLFSSAGIAETYFNDINIQIQVANEIDKKDVIFLAIYTQMLT